METIQHISQEFTQISGATPAVKVLCSVPLSRRVSNYYVRRRWAIEYHEAYAGKVLFRDGAIRHLKREADTIHLYAPECCYGEDSSDAEFPVRENYMVIQGGERIGLREFVDAENGFARFFDYKKQVGALFAEAVEVCAKYREGSFWLVQAKFMEILYRLRHHRRISSDAYVLEEPGEKKKTGFAAEIMDFMRRDPARVLRISDIAFYMKVSESTLNHKFKEETGRTPIACMLEFRVNYAKGLLLKGERLKSIAKATGFHDEYHFSKTFKKVTGQSPREFRGR